MSEYLRTLLIVCPLIFIGAFIDAVAGGGGLITLPAYMLAGLPTHMAAGTNKLVASLGSASASVKYIRSGSVVFTPALCAAAGAFLGAAAGSRLAVYLPDRVLRIIIVAALPVVAAIVLTRRDFGESAEKDLSRRKEMLVSLAIGLCIGMYDGLVGPGTGTFLMLAFCAFLGLDLLHATGCAKISNLASNIASVIVFALNGNINYSVALPAICFSVAGGLLGARYAVRGGNRNIKRVLALVLVLLFAKLAYDLLF